MGHLPAEEMPPFSQIPPSDRNQLPHPSSPIGLAETMPSGKSQIELTNIPVGPDGTKARKIYRTDKTGSDGTIGLVGTLSNNTDRTFDDLMSDGQVDRSLTPPSPGTGTAPAVGGVVTTPVAPTATSGPGLDAGTYRYKITFVDAKGKESNASEQVTATVSTGNVTDKKNALRLDNIPLGPAGTHSRKIYRSSAGKSGDLTIGTDFALVYTVPDNTTTTYTDGQKDQLHPVTTTTVAYPHWTPLTDPMPSLSITSVVFDPTDPSHKTLYAGTGVVSSSFQGGNAIGVLKTTDSGYTWTIKGGTDTELKGLKITSVVATQYKDTSAPGGAIKPVLLVSTVQDGDRGGLYRSVDGGDTWTRISGLASSSLPEGNLTDLKDAPDPNNAGNHLLFAAHAGANDTHADAGIYKSSDGGATWMDITSRRQEFAGDGTQTAFNYT
jgi:hypothetical protein